MEHIRRKVKEAYGNKQSVIRMVSIVNKKEESNCQPKFTKSEFERVPNRIFRPDAKTRNRRT